jgi:hypothetical protein
MSTGIGTTSSLGTTSGVSEASVILQKALGLSTSTSSQKSTKIIDSLKSELESKQQQYDQINDLLLLVDIDLDMYDELITNIDSRIPEPIEEINTKITAVQDAYRDRVDIGCKNDLHWVLQSTKTVSGIDTLGNPFSKNYTTYKVEKIASEYRTINYYGAKYYKRPKDRDYGSSAVKEIPSASVGIGSTYMVLYDTTTDANGFTILSGIQTNDTITDSIESPLIFTVGSLPEVVGFGSTALLGISTTFGGSISLGSTILAYSGVNTTSGISTGDPIWRTGITSTDSVVVGFGTTTISVTGIDTAGVSTSFQIDTTSVILSKPAIASTSQTTFNVGIYTSYPTIFISETTVTGTVDDNFFVLRQTGSAESFDPRTNGENPVEVGLIKDENKTGYGHIISLINNGNPDVTKTYTEEVDPEPSVGAGFASYYEGNESWPGVLTPTLSGVPPVVTGYTFSYATEGQTLTTITGVGSTAVSSGIGYTGTSSLAPSAGTCSAADAAIATAESELTSIETTNLPVINDYISKSATLRTIRDGKQSKAWAYRRGRGAINNEIIQLQTDSDTLESLDLEEFE